MIRRTTRSEVVPKEKSGGWVTRSLPAAFVHELK
jgi:hypothetical protein